jgi:hypothetical protein
MAQPLIRYPFPLQDGTIIYLEIPPTFSIEDFDRVSNFLSSLIVDWPEKQEE